jgi:hypothetical protein
MRVAGEDPVVQVRSNVTVGAVALCLVQRRVGLCEGILAGLCFFAGSQQHIRRGADQLGAARISLPQSRPGIGLSPLRCR